MLQKFEIGEKKIHLVVRDDESAMQVATRTAGFESLHCSAHKIQLISLYFSYILNFKSILVY